VADGEPTVELVDAAQGGPAALAVVAPLHQFADEDVGVVVAPLGAQLKLLRAVEQRRDTRHREGAEQSQFQGARRVEGEVAPAAQQDDALGVALRVELPDFVEDARPCHAVSQAHGPQPVGSLMQTIATVSSPQAQGNTASSSGSGSTSSPTTRACQVPR